MRKQLFSYDLKSGSILPARQKDLRLFPGDQKRKAGSIRELSAVWFLPQCFFCCLDDGRDIYQRAFAYIAAGEQ